MDPSISRQREERFSRPECHQGPQRTALGQLPQEPRQSGSETDEALGGVGPQSGVQRSGCAAAGSVRPA